LERFGDYAGRGRKRRGCGVGIGEAREDDCVPDGAEGCGVEVRIGEGCWLVDWIRLDRRGQSRERRKEFCERKDLRGAYERKKGLGDKE